MLPWRALVAMIVLLSPTTCYGPVGSPVKLEAIAAEAHELMRLPRSEWKSVNDRRLPPTIASLLPGFVIVDESGVDIVTTPFIDGGWGYYVPRSAQPSPSELFRHQSMGHGVYWFHPY